MGWLSINDKLPKKSSANSDHLQETLIDLPRFIHIKTRQIVFCDLRGRMTHHFSDLVSGLASTVQSGSLQELSLLTRFGHESAGVLI